MAPRKMGGGPSGIRTHGRRGGLAPRAAAASAPAYAHVMVRESLTSGKGKGKRQTERGEPGPGRGIASRAWWPPSGTAVTRGSRRMGERSAALADVMCGCSPERRGWDGMWVGREGRPSTTRSGAQKRSTQRRRLERGKSFSDGTTSSEPPRRRRDSLHSSLARVDLRAKIRWSWGQRHCVAQNIRSFFIPLTQPRIVLMWNDW
jgi:hypothetical protein